MSQEPNDFAEPKHASLLKGLLITHFDELHAYAVRQIAREAPGQSLDATALINEVVIRMLEPDKLVAVNDSGHFISIAKVMMKHILTDRARHKQTERAGGQFHRLSLEPDLVDGKQDAGGYLIFREELRILAAHDPAAAKIVELRCNGYSITQAARQLNISRSVAYDLWNFGRAWLMKSLLDSNSA